MTASPYSFKMCVSLANDKNKKTYFFQENRKYNIHVALCVCVLLLINKCGGQWSNYEFKLIITRFERLVGEKNGESTLVLIKISESLRVI